MMNLEGFCLGGKKTGRSNSLLLICSFIYSGGVLFETCFWRYLCCCCFFYCQVVYLWFLFIYLFVLIYFCIVKVLFLVKIFINKLKNKRIRFKEKLFIISFIDKQSNTKNLKFGDPITFFNFLNTFHSLLSFLIFLVSFMKLSRTAEIEKKNKINFII